MMKKVNLEQLSQFAADKDEMRRLCAGFFGQVDGIMASLKGACGALQAEQWRQTAHKLKGSAANLGAEMLRELAASAEHESDAPEGRKQEMVTVLEQELTAVRRFLTEKLGEF